MKIPCEVYEEIELGNDDLRHCLRKHRDALLLQEEMDAQQIQVLVDPGYGPDLTAEEVNRIGADPVLIAYAYRDREQRTVVTSEVSKPTLQRANRRIPDLCRDLGVRCCNTFQFIEELNFTTGWNR